MVYLESNRKKDFTGCGLCSFKCPKKAIKMVYDEEGFLYPIIDKNKCINCNLCLKICSRLKEMRENTSESYIAINNDKEDLYNSSSGGMFSILARYVLSNNGIVFGVEYNRNMVAKHDCITSVDELNKLRGSKYVRSDFLSSFEKIKKYLEKGKLVLFTGTPCQCNSIKNYIGENDKLITCDIICHSNPSPLVFKMYVSCLESKYKKKVKNIKFRTKEIGWHCADSIVVFDDNTQVIESSFYKAFMEELLNRPSCHSCNYCNSERCSDFTIGDLWGIDKVDNEIIDDNTGISLLMINSQKARNIFDIIKKDMLYKRIPTDKALEYNHNHNNNPNPKRDKFFAKISKGNINENNIIDKLNRYSKKPIYRKVFDRLKKVLKK